MRKLVLFLVIVAAVGLVAFIVLRAGPAPQIAIEPGGKAIGAKTPVTVRVSVPKRGLADIKVELVQGGVAHTLALVHHQPAPV